MENVANLSDVIIYCYVAQAVAALLFPLFFIRDFLLGFMFVFSRQSVFFPALHYMFFLGSVRNHFIPVLTVFTLISSVAKLSLQNHPVFFSRSVTPLFGALSAGPLPPRAKTPISLFGRSHFVFKSKILYIIWSPPCFHRLSSIQVPFFFRSPSSEYFSLLRQFPPLFLRSFLCRSRAQGDCPRQLSIC